MTNQKTTEKIQVDERRMASLCSSIFSQPDAMELLKLYDKYFTQMPVAHPDKSDRHACFREGQNDMIRRFKAGIGFHTINKRGQNDGSNPDTI